MFHERKPAPRSMTAVTVIAVICSLAGGVLFLQIQQRQQRHQIEARLLDIAQLKVSQIVDWRSERVADAMILMTRRDLIRGIQQFLASPDAPAKKNLLEILEPVKGKGHYSDILIADLDDHVRFSFSNDLYRHQGFQFSKEAALKSRQPCWTELHKEPAYGYPHISLVTPIFVESAEITPVCTVVMILDAAQYLYPLVQSWPTPSKTAETLLIRKEGNDVLFLNELRHQSGTALNLRIPMTQADLPAAMAAAGTTGIVKGKDYRNVDVLAAVYPIPGSSWFIVAKMDANEAFSDWRFRSWLIILLILSSTFMVIVGSIFIEQRHLKAYYRELYKSEAALRASVELHSVTLHAIGDAVISTDAHGRISFMNPVAEQLTGWTIREARGKPVEQVFKIISEETRKVVDDPVAKVLNEGLIVGLANHTLLVSKDGKEIPIADSGAPIFDEEERIIGVVLVFRDQLEERAARLMTELRLNLIDYANRHTLKEMMQWFLDELGVFINNTDGVYTLIEPGGGNTFLQQLSSGAENAFSGIQQIQFRCSGDVSVNTTGFCIRKTPVVHNQQETESPVVQLPVPWHRELVVPVIRENEVIAAVAFFNKPAAYSEYDLKTVSSLADLTYEIFNNKRIEEDLRKSEAALIKAQKIAHVGNWTWSIRENTLKWSDEMYRIFGIEKEKFTGNLNDIINKAIHPDDRSRVEASNQSVIQDKRPVPLEYRIIHPDGNVRTVWAEAGDLILDEKGGPLVLSGIVQDITERKQRQEQIEKNLKEKEVLIRELYHRTKNNMQVISSMLRLKARTIADRNMRFTLHEIENKIQSMALVHKKLYESQDLSVLNLKSYFEDLLGLIRDSYMSDTKSIDLTYEAIDAPVVIDIAIPLGLVINELLSNAVKHAFPDNKKGHIHVSVYRNKSSELVIDVNDNGKGLSPGFDIEKDSHLGLETVIDLVKNQLNGSVTFRNRNGLHCRIRLKEGLYKPRV